MTIHSNLLPLSQEQIDIDFMRLALKLAKRSLGSCWPNPAVGCLIVDPKKQTIISRGWTASSGRPHAEQVAIERAGERARGCTAYVSLEPCCHHGHTPPCTDALINAGVKRVVVAVNDPDPRMQGKSLNILRQSGIEVVEGLLKNEAIQLNKGFFNKLQKNRPLIALKLATTLDGKIASYSGKSQWITNDLSREYSHRLRQQFDAIIVGTETILNDDPKLNCRLLGQESLSPVRIVLDKSLRIPMHYNVFKETSNQATWLFTNSRNQKKISMYEEKGIKLFQLSLNKQKQLSLTELFRTLMEQNITRVFCEGGATLITSFISENLYDEIYWFTSPSYIGGDGKSCINALDIEDVRDLKMLDEVESFNLKGNRLSHYMRKAA